MDFDIQSVPDDLKMLEIPLDNIYTLSVVYLTPDEEIDNIIAANKFTTYPITK